jgi:hypothetical protein
VIALKEATANQWRLRQMSSQFRKGEEGKKTFVVTTLADARDAIAEFPSRLHAAHAGYHLVGHCTPRWTSARTSGVAWLHPDALRLRRTLVRRDQAGHAGDCGANRRGARRDRPSGAVLAEARCRRCRRRPGRRSGQGGQQDLSGETRGCDGLSETLASSACSFASAEPAKATVRSAAANCATALSFRLSVARTGIIIARAT